MWSGAGGGEGSAGRRGRSRGRRGGRSRRRRGRGGDRRGRTTGRCTGEQDRSHGPVTVDVTYGDDTGVAGRLLRGGGGTRVFGGVRRPVPRGGAVGDGRGRDGHAASRRTHRRARRRWSGRA